MATYFALAQDKSTPIVAAALAVAAVFWIINWKARRPDAPPFRMGVAEALGLALLTVNVCVMGYQTIQLAGLNTAAKTFVLEAVLVAMMCRLFMIYAPDRLSRLLVTLALGFAIFGVLNLLADAFGIGSELLLARSDSFSSRYLEGVNRWQAPLYSSWQVAGLLRWAMPVLLAAMLARPRGWAERAILFAAALIAGYVLVLCEYRASAFPLIGAIIWLCAFRFRPRAFLSLGYLSYAFAAPLIFTATAPVTALDHFTPDFVFRLAGNQNPLEVLSLTGRTDWWSIGLQTLLSGKHLLVGEGHVLFDAITDIGMPPGLNPDLFRRLSYHQAALDLLFIYGALPGLALVASMLWVTGKAAFAPARATATESSRAELSFALFAVGMVGLANCHDGFFVEHNFFYVICITAACTFVTVIRQCAMKEHARAERPLASREAAPVAAPATGRTSQIAIHN